MGRSKKDTEDSHSNEEQIIRCIKLGMDLQSAMYTVACTDKEMEALEKDEKFMRRVHVTASILEMNLLDDHNDAMNLQLAQGKTTAAQWKLERVNPNRWSRSNNDDGNNNVPAVVIVEIPGLDDMLHKDDRIGAGIEEGEDDGR